MRPLVQTARDNTFVCVTQHRPPSGAVVAAPAHFHFSPRDWGVQHLGSQRVCVLILSSNPLPDHPRAQHRVVASQILKQKEREPCRFSRDVSAPDPPLIFYSQHIYKPKENACLSLTEFNGILNTIVCAWWEEVFSIRFLSHLRWWRRKSSGLGAKDLGHVHHTR